MYRSRYTDLNISVSNIPGSRVFSYNVNAKLSYVMTIEVFIKSILVLLLLN